MTLDLDLCNPGVHIFLSLYVSAKIFTLVGLIIALEENGAHTVSGSAMLKNYPRGEKTGKFDFLPASLLSKNMYFSPSEGLQILP